MYRELTTNEMEMVSGGSGDQDEIIVVGTRRSSSSWMSQSEMNRWVREELNSSYPGLLERGGYTRPGGEAPTDSEANDPTNSTECELAREWLDAASSILAGQITGAENASFLDLVLGVPAAVDTHDRASAAVREHCYE